MSSKNVQYELTDQLHPPSFYIREWKVVISLSFSHQLSFLNNFSIALSNLSTALLGLMGTHVPIVPFLQLLIVLQQLLTICKQCTSNFYNCNLRGYTTSWCSDGYNRVVVEVELCRGPWLNQYWPFFGLSSILSIKIFSLSTVVSRDRNYFLFFESHARLGILTSAYRLLPSFHMKLLKEIILDSIFIDLWYRVLWVNP